MAAVLAAALVAAGCGGGGSDISTVSLTKPQYLKKADAICEEDYAHRTASLVRDESKIRGMSTAEEEEVVVNIVLPTYRRDVAELTQLGVPKGHEAEVEKVLSTFEETLDRVEADPGSILAGASKQFGELEQLTHKFGYERCGRS